MSCLDDRTILDLLHGGLDEVARRRAEDELARCARCAAVVGALLRDHANGRGEGDATLVDMAGEPEPGDDEMAHDVLCDVIALGLGTSPGAFGYRPSRRAAHRRLDASDATPTARMIRVAAPFDGRANRLRRSMRHRGRAWIVAVLCAIALGSVAGVSVRRIQRARDNAELQRLNAERERAAVATARGAP
jgi:hypothetical protein